jgi:predicted permease
LTMQVAMSQGRSQKPEDVRSFQDDLTTRVSSLPGVIGTTIIDILPLTGAGNSGGFVVVGDVTKRETVTLVRAPAANYFDVMGIRLEAGRTFAPTDLPASPRVVVINRALADLAFPGAAAVGQRIEFPFMPGQVMEIAGIVGNEQYDAIDRAIRPVLYFPQSQSPNSNFSLLVRTASDPAAMISAVVEAAGRLDPGTTLSGRVTMEQIMNASEAVFRRRSVLTLIGGFAAAALLLAAVGLYGVLTQVVAQSTREIGVRLALGARRADIASAVIRRGLIPVAVGLAVGLGGSVLVGRYLGGLLYGTSATDPLTLSLVVAALSVTALVACVIPARRALRVDPVEALRG